MYYDREGRAIGRTEWLELQNDDAYRIVQHTTVTPVAGNVPMAEVWTSWLGADPNPFHGDDPTIFDTVATRFGQGFGLDRRLYGSLDEARCGHAEAVALMVDAVGPCVVRDVPAPAAPAVGREFRWVQRNVDKPQRCPECHAVRTWDRTRYAPRTRLSCPRCGVRWRVGDRAYPLRVNVW
ncbi:zinc-ribbon domain-containing protein [Amycolatopsis sp. DSM 110486]|uniref:zinc-ribbon domain-containing protein n=1 Tax=Amycolatopsis sp. DSM 110486 TaxID=2865832 RepID=UPI001C69FDAC|nr:zinc-ribbon domain-containing protein [Amycolatopsis sp. DSM 110486]QYN17489.1 zinc-ribbon domain-containing protein [Amycolatopsis sp. DSM 110486]